MKISDRVLYVLCSHWGILVPSGPGESRQQLSSLLFDRLVHCPRPALRPHTGKKKGGCFFLGVEMER